MGEWAPLGPAADPVERRLVLVEGARVAGPSGQDDNIPKHIFFLKSESSLTTLFMLKPSFP